MNTSHLRSRQSGAALLVALIMLLVVTMIGLASIRSTTLNEKMSSNMYDRSLSYQGAEAALRAGEAAIEADQTLGRDCTNANTNCPSIPTNTFTNNTDGWATVAADYRVNSAKLGSTPQYYIEKMGTVGGTDELDIGSSANCANYAGCDQSAPNAVLFRITGRSGVPAGDGRSVVALQITVKQNL
ncbi:pilus assembly PilX family protein [Halopseudomonas sabulinigri]|uniref:Type IV pilus assembly protein PilX n=1 Tax=Halopseudomonas sabulinigri TaxID=472181 RepID=A0A1H1R2H4_9GAMM|nr:PilX N-terminal domain-containing pilus assembly protein [Halopseudomonas sabulinigri]SDS29830.1 type IV pilus assembly protein PilX [Halopseudomonas sabulinigri]